MPCKPGVAGSIPGFSIKHYRLSLREFLSYNKHTNHKPSQPSTGFYPWKSHKKFSGVVGKLHTVKLWSLELACLEHQGSLELIRRSRQFPYTFNVKIHPRVEQQWLELKARSAGRFFMLNRYDGSNQIFFT